MKIIIPRRHTVIESDTPVVVFRTRSKLVRPIATLFQAGFAVL